MIDQGQGQAKRAVMRTSARAAAHRMPLGSAGRGSSTMFLTMSVIGTAM